MPVLRLGLDTSGSPLAFVCVIAFSVHARFQVGAVLDRDAGAERDFGSAAGIRVGGHVVETVKRRRRSVERLRGQQAPSCLSTTRTVRIKITKSYQSDQLRTYQRSMSMRC